jgi:predicted NBD/HSP70 family sugar kinase
MRISDREFNRLRVLKTLRRAEPISRTDLAALCGLDGGTITDISATLLTRGLIREEKIATGKRGRPQRHLRLDPHGALGLGAYVGVQGELTCEIVNLRGDQVHLSAFPIPPTHSMEELAQTLGELIQQAIASSKLGTGALACIGVALPALVDSRNGDLHWVQTMPARPYATARHIEDMLAIPVFLDNNTNVLARAEHWFGEGKRLDDFVLINLGYGISAARYSGGDLVLGTHGLNSEAGHSKIVVEDGRACTCGAYGCLNAYCSVVALVQQGCEVTGTKMPGYPDLDAALHALVAQAKRGHQGLNRLFDRAARYLGATIANLVNAQDPGRVVLLCEHADLPAIYAGTLPYFEAAVLPPLRGKTTVEFRAFEQDLFRKGAAALVLHRLYKSL